MRIDEITLHNFGPYRGEQHADLLPPSPSKPVILFGGLNGAGKTTILEAIQLSLYGNLAEPVRRSGLAYDEYLRRAANRLAPPHEGSAVGLTFSVNELGQAKTYRLRRTWSIAGSTKKPRESLDVWVNGERDGALSEAWPDQVAQFLPPRLAPLFFFDGERIEQLADPEQSAAALKTAVGALLGADLVDQLGADLEIMMRRRRVERATESDNRLPEAEKILEEAEARRQAAIQKVASARAALDRSLELSRRADQQYAEQGGRAADERRATESARAAVHSERLGIEREMASLASGDLPLSLVLPMLGQTAKTLEQQTVRAERQAAAGILHEAAARLERDLIAANVAARTLQLVRDWATREKRVMADGAAATFPDAGSTLARLRHLLEGSLGAEVAACRKLLARHADASARLDELDRSLAMTPDADAIQDSAEARRAALVEVGARQQEHVAAEAAANEITREVESRRREMDKLIEANRIARGEASDGERFVRHATGVKLALDRFGTRLRRRHLERLEKLILECYRALVHKSHLARGLRIDPNTYTINLTDGAAMEVRPERLSAGERQLLAVSILWGMARASGRPLPVAIDTPLGRLDGIHRRQLVERYFPHAAGQVILLSTDEEVDAELHALLGPFIGRAYRLNHDEMSGTQISVGYPFASEPIPKDSQHLLK